MREDKKQVCLRPRDRFWDIPVPKIDSAFDNLLVPQPSWSPSTTQQLRKLVAAPYLAPNDWTPRSEAYFVFPLAQGTPGKQCGLAATGVYQPSLRSPWLAAVENADTGAVGAAEGYFRRGCRYFQEIIMNYPFKTICCIISSPCHLCNLEYDKVELISMNALMPMDA
ncbi:hypothetical protein, partial [Thiolapillus sp.]|uniref:hypothetical protein n=1 Tax=Thiolapillus sp. TaxID=2017437 RepID=UPI003AF8E922